MTKLQMIMEIAVVTDDYSLEELKKLWHAELKVLHHAVTKEGYKKHDLIVYNIEENNDE